MPLPPHALRHVLGASYSGGGVTFPTSTNLLLSHGGRLQTIDLSAGRARTLPFEATRDIQHVRAHNDTAVVIDTDDRLSLVSLSTGRSLARMSVKHPVVDVALHSSWLALSSATATHVWRLPRKLPAFAPFDLHARFARGGVLSWSKDGQRLAAGGADGSVAVFSMIDTKRRILPAVLFGHRAAVVLVAFVGERGLLTLSQDGVLFCWRLRDNETPGDGAYVPVRAALASRHFAKRHAKAVSSAALHSDVVAVGLSNGVFCLLQLPEHMSQESVEFDRGLFELSKPTSDKPHIDFTDLVALQTLSVANAPVSHVEFNASGEYLAMACKDAAQALVWEWRSETHVLKQHMHALPPTAAALSPDGRAVVTGAGDGRVKVWAVATGLCIATFKDHEAAVSAVVFAANDVVVSASKDGSVRAFDLRRYINFRVMAAPPPRRQFSCVAVDEAAELVAAGCVDTFEIIVWSLRTGAVVEILNGHQGPVSSVAFRPRRGALVSGSWDKTIRVWSMYERKGGVEVLEHSKEVLSVAFRPDGRELATSSAGGEIMLWDVDRGTVRGSIEAGRHVAGGRGRMDRTVAETKGTVQTLCYSADGRFLLGGGGKFVCMFLVAEGGRPVLVERIQTTVNHSFDGLTIRLNSKNEGDVLGGGEDEDVRDAKLLPGTHSEKDLRRKGLLRAEVRCVAACKTGRLWAAATTEGVLVYGDETGDDVFDPTNLDVEVTPKTIQAAVGGGEFALGLMLALRLNEREWLNWVVDRLPLEVVGVVVEKVSTLFFARLVLLFAWRMEQSPHLEVNLTWAKRILLAKGGRSEGGDPAAVNAALRALNRAVAAHSKRLVPLADRNVHMLEYLVAVGGEAKQMADATQPTAAVAQ